MVLLDWENAFDKVDHRKLLESLYRIVIPPKVCRVIKNLYISTSFFIAMNNRNSAWKDQLTGIRQGCPLSPYLFLILMTVLFHDIHGGACCGY